MKFWKKHRNLFVVSAILLLTIISIFTKFYGNADIYDYANVAKFFAGDLEAKIRTSHSYLYGLIHSPIVDITDSFLVFKFSNLLFLSLLIYSVYRISGKNKSAFWLTAFSPLVWYMAPWVSPIQLASLLFLWGYYFIKEYSLNHKLQHLTYSGILIGLSWAFWDGVLFFIPLLAISFLYNKKLAHSLLFVIFIGVGILPRLILDQVLFGFAFYGIIRHILASMALVLYGGFYNQSSLSGLLNFVLLLVFIPWSSYLLFKRKIFAQNKPTVIFLLLSLFVLIANSQIRLLLLITPIIILTLINYLSRKQYIIQLTIFIILTVLVVNPYVIQLKSSLGDLPFQGHDIGSMIIQGSLNLQNSFPAEQLLDDLSQISEEYPQESFVVGNKDDSYAALAAAYWGEDIKEFVSLQDYKFYTSNNSIVFKKEFCTNVKISERRDFCASIWIQNAFNDKTDYPSIKYALSGQDTIELEGFSPVKKYSYLTLFEKV